MEKIFFQKADTSCVIRGTIHLAPKEHYNNIQKELFHASLLNAAILREGIYKDAIENLDSDQQKVAKYILHTSRIIKLAAQLSGLSAQIQSIKYPESAIRADLSISEIARIAVTSNIVPTESDMQDVYLSDEDLKKLLSAEFRNLDHASIMKRVERRIAAKQNNSFMSQLLKVTHKPREQILINLIEKFAVIKDYIYVVYGINHLPHLAQMLENSGWRKVDDDPM